MKRTNNHNPNYARRYRNVLKQMEALRLRAGDVNLENVNLRTRLKARRIDPDGDFRMVHCPFCRELIDVTTVMEQAMARLVI